MKFKYKKIVLTITMGTMCIGLVTISLTTPKVSSSEKESVEVTTQGAVDTPLATQGGLVDSTGVPLSSGILKCNAYPKVNQLAKKYLNATISGNIAELKECVYDTEGIKEAELKAKQNLIEAYNNIECYTIDGEKEGSYLVYVYHEVKFANVAVAAPGLTRFYVTTKEDGNLAINLNVVDTEEQNFISECDESAEVLQLIQTVNFKLKEAISSDTELKQFYEKMNNGSTSIEIEATDAPLSDTEAANE